MAVLPRQAIGRKDSEVRLKERPNQMDLLNRLELLDQLGPMVLENHLAIHLPVAVGLLLLVHSETNKDDLHLIEPPTTPTTVSAVETSNGKKLSRLGARPRYKSTLGDFAEPFGR